MSTTAHCPPSADHWDAYWRGTRENAAHKEGGPQEEILADFWRAMFSEHLALHPESRILDLACGNGAVTGFAREIAPDLPIHCSDYSLNALLELHNRHTNCHTAAADAARMPFRDASFDLVASQFGVEYAGLGAISEAARLVAPGGILALLLHIHEGAIYRECQLNRDTVHAIQKLDILALARTAFTAGFELNRGVATAADFKAAERAFTPAVRGLEEILRTTIPAVAGGLPRQLYQDVAHMYQKMSAYEPSEVLAWLRAMEFELQAYAGRMQSMLDVALDETAFRETVNLLAARGFSGKRTETLGASGQRPPFAWMLVMGRQ